MTIIYGKTLGLRGKVRESGASPGGLLQGTPFASIYATQPIGIQMLETPPLPAGVFGSKNHNNDD